MLMAENKAQNMYAGEMEKGDLVWFDPGVGHVLPGEVLEFHRAAQVLTVQALIGGKPQVFTLTNLTGVRRRQDLGQNGVEDMIQLSDLNEASLLWNLKLRYDKELIYTYTGSILIAVNPYKMFDIYGLDMVKQYEGQILGTLAPHLFAIASASYAHMSKEGSTSPESQVVVISGESGSGKTESTKLVMQYLAAVNKSSSNLVTEQILEASPLLESFGNAKTVRNDNSSRFGKYLEVHFKNGVINGARVTEYLLEKSRIVTQAPEERNYHVFYEMLQGLKPEQKEKYGLLTPEKYFYLNQGGSYEIDGKYDGDDFQSLLSAMQVLGFSADEQDTIFRILATVLHLGNVYFHRKQLKHGQEGVEIGSDAEVRWAGHLLELDVDGIKRALTTKTTEARNERVLTALSIDQALDARDAFAKALYNALFSWLVARINHIVFKSTKRTATISILDIFGFEDFKENSFEQLCINYANENLQFYFNKHIFKLEQQEYAKERIDWQTISYTDNLPVIHLIAKKPVGILHLLDDESNFPRASDVSFLEKCHYNHALDELYSRPRLASMEFGVRHYAGQVWYSVDGFLDKNRDTLRQDVVELLIGSKIQMVSRMFQQLRSTHEAGKTLTKANGRFVTMKPRTPTVAARFHDSLQQLLESMSKCNPWFVRCIKPNGDKAAMRYDMPIVLEQLRYTGMLDTIRIRKTGYPVRLKFSQFVERFRYLLPHRGSAGAPHRELCRAILSAADPHAADHQLGTTRIFLREPLERRLEGDRAAVVGAAAVTLQRHVRGAIARRRYASQRRAALVVQTRFRGWRDRSRYERVRKGVVQAQALYRGKKQRDRYQQLKVELKRRAEVEKQARERARVKAQRDEAERASRAVAGVNHLEIPAELAFIFSKLDDWQPAHAERNLVKVVGGVENRQDRYRLPSDVDQHAFAKFTNIYFKSHLWGMKREPIKTPFLAKSKDMDYQDSLALFKLILRFTNDNNLSGKKEVALGDYIVNKGIVNEKLRDEILCQLCNQTWRNDNDANNERGWLLMANCLSAFPPSKTLYKYLLKYASDHGYNGYKAVCQRKLLQSARVESQLARRYPPCLLEWRANRKRVNMALEMHFADGESRTSGVDSWTTSEEIAATVLHARGITELEGWTVALSPDSDTDDAVTKETNGLDYILDLIGEMELAPSFPACKDSFLTSGPASMSGVAKATGPPQRRLGVKVTPPKISPSEADDAPPPSPRRPNLPPPEPPSAKQVTRKLSHEPPPAPKPAGRVRSQSRDHTGLSRKSALNDRYFEDKGRSRSLDNLLEAELPPTRKLEALGLSHSRLNERYHSIEKVNLLAVTNQEYMSRAEAFMEENFESVSQRGDKYNSRATDLSGSAAPPDDEDVTLDFEYNPSSSAPARPTTNPRFIKSSSAGKRPAAPGSHSSRAYIDARNNTGDVKSSALSDTSEAPSLASHVRRVRVPSQASDVDQFLDDLFMPVLDGNLDELADARSLAASIKGGGRNIHEQDKPTLANSSEEEERPANEREDDEVATITSATSTLRLPRASRHGPTTASSAENVDDYITALFQPIFVNASLQRLTRADKLAGAIKGGGRVMESRPSPAPPGAVQNAFNFTPIRGTVTSPTPMMMSPPPMMMPPMSMFAPAVPFPGMAPGTYPGQDASYYGAGPMSAPGSPPQPAFMPVPIYNMQGMSLPPFGTAGMAQPGMGSPSGIDPSLAAAYQQNLQRAFLQSAMAHNMQVQQQLMAQNQALQHLLVQPSPQTPVSFREPDNTDLWSTEKQRVTPSRSNGPPVPVKSQPRTPPGHGIQHETTIRAQVHRTQSPPSSRFVAAQRPGAKYSPPAASTAFTSVLSELRNRRGSVDSNKTGMSVPPPPPPMPPPPELVDPSETRPFLDPYGRAKTVRIGKWRWPPPKAAVDEAGDSFLLFKQRQHHQRKTTPQQQEYGDMPEGVEWEEFEIESLLVAQNNGTPPRKESCGSGVSAKRDSSDSSEKPTPTKSLDSSAPRGAPGSIGKLRISSEMRNKLEMVTANHSVRSTNKPEKAGVKHVMETPQRPVKKLEDNRKMLLEQQLAGRWETAETVDGVSKEERRDVQQTNIVRSQVERMEKPALVKMTSWDKPVAPANGWERQHSGWDVSPIAHQSSSPWEKAGNGANFNWDKLNATASSATSPGNNNWRPAPPPPPVTPGGHHIHHHHQDNVASRTSSFYAHSNTPALPAPRTPPPPIQPVRHSSSGGMFNSQYSNNRDMFAGGRAGDSFRVQENGHHHHHDGYDAHSNRRSSVSTHLTDKMERIEIAESSEFLRPVDDVAPLIVDRRRDAATSSAKLHGASTAAYFTYNRVAWRLAVRKEVFAPGEALTAPLALHLVFCQVVRDVLGGASVRIGREHRARMKKLLDSYGVTLNNLQSSHQKVTIKKNVIDVAKDWPTYFSRIFPVSGGHQHPTVQHLAVSHSGVRLARVDAPGEPLRVLDTIGYEDLVEVAVPKPSALEITTAAGARLTLYTHRANQVREMVARFAARHDKLQQKSVPRAIADSYHAPSAGVGGGKHGGGDWHARGVAQQQHHAPPTSPTPTPGNNKDASTEQPSGQQDGKHSLLQFAMLHFRASPEKFEMMKTADGSISGSLKVLENSKNKKNKKEKKEKGGNKENDWTWKEQVDLVKFTPTPVETSLLRLETQEMSDLAVECFASVMRYMGDLPMTTDLSEVKCVYTILMHCHKHESLRDEVYCQLMKQTTNNKSTKPDSCQRGWRLFSIVAAYFTCSDTLKPYLYKYLETAAYDKRRAYHGTATVCLQNLRKTFKHGGRKNVPSVEELTAISAGRNSKRQIYQLPGGSERVVNTKSTTVVQDVIEEMCAVINVQTAAEMEEFSLYCIVEGDTFTMPLARDEYILDVTTELHKNQQVYYLIFCRSVWHFPLRLDSQLYIEVVFNQIAPDYLEGLLLVMPGEQLDQDVIYDIAKMAALLHRAADMTTLPTMKETKFLLPKPALAVRDVKPGQWVNMVQGNWREVEALQTIQAKAQVLEILSKWPLFGSSFFAVKRVSEPKDRSEHILALNRHGVHFIDLVTHETLTHYTFSEVISTRKVKSEDGTLFLDMKCGNLMQQRITRLQTDQAHEISRLIRQYITMEQKLRA